MRSTITIDTDVSAIDVTIVSAMMPRTSSIIAAPRIALPEWVLSLPISFRVSTVIETEVAVRMTPMNRFCRYNGADRPELIIPGRLKYFATKYPPISGTMTPIKAMTKDAFPVRFNSWTSVSSPAVNISTMTPISAESLINCVSEMTFSIAGPRISPAKSAPTTCGIWTRLVKRPNTFVDKSMSAKSKRNL